MYNDGGVYPMILRYKKVTLTNLKRHSFTEYFSVKVYPYVSTTLSKKFGVFPIHVFSFISITFISIMRLRFPSISYLFKHF